MSRCQFIVRTLMAMLFLTISLSSVEAGSQIIKGHIVDDANEPLPGASVTLFKADSTQHFKGAVSDENGDFQLDGLDFGTYRLEVSYMGFTTRVLRPRLTQERKNADYKKIVLSEDAQLLTAVEVSATNTSLKVDIDKKTFLVNSSAVGDGMSTTEILKEIPSVDIDVEGNVSLRNNENVVIYINGKPAGLNDENSGDILDQLPAGSVEKVEVITNPSSKFDAEGSSGIINIVMKKGAKETISFGSVTAGVMFPWHSKPGGNVGANYNFSRDKWGFYVGFDLAERRMYGISENDRETYRSDTTFLRERGESDQNFKSGFLRLGTDYRIDEKNTISLAGMMSMGGRLRDESRDFERGSLLSGVDSLASIQQRSSLLDNSRTMGNVSLNYQHDFAQGHTLSTDINFFCNKAEEKKDYDQAYFTPNNVLLEDTKSYQRLDDSRKNRTGEVKVDYVNPLTNKSKLEAGVKLSHQRQESETESWMKDAYASDFTAQSELTNDFVLKTNIYAAYASYGHQFNSFGLQLGLRSEVTDMDWSLDTENGLTERDKKPYVDFFPTVFFSYKAPKDNELQLSFTRRIMRPRNFWLNPFVNLSDSTNISFGNPDLDPEYTNSFELGYIKSFPKGHIFMSSLYYKLTQDVIQRYSVMGDDDVLFTTRENLTSSHAAGLELVLKNRFKYVNLTSNVNLYYYLLEGGEFDVNMVMPGREPMSMTAVLDDRQSFSWTAQVAADFTLPQAITLQLSGNFRSKTPTAQGEVKEVYFMNFGARKFFFSRKLSVMLSVRDLLNSRRRVTETWGDNFYQLATNRRMGRNINLSVTYNFGNKSKNKKEGGRDGSVDEDDSFDDF